MRETFDQEQAKRFLTQLAEGDGKHVTFQTYGETPATKDTLARVIHAHPRVLDELTRLNDAGAGVFLTINRTDGHGRTADNIIGVRAVFADLDGAPLEPVLQAPLEPHVIVASSPGRWHCYWRVEDCPREQFRPLQLAIARKFHSDEKVADLPRVMRLPGSVSRKHGTPFAVRIQQETPAQAYRTAEIIERLGLDVTAKRPNGADTSDDAHKRVISGGGAGVHDALLTLAARYVARGLPPEQIIELLQALMDAAPWRRHDDPDQRRRWESRRAEIPGLVKSASRKFTPDPSTRPRSALRSNLANAIDACGETLAGSGLQVFHSAFFGARFGQRNGAPPYRWVDFHDLEVASAVQRVPAFERISVEHIRQALEAIAQQTPRDEIVDWLDSLSWDGTARLDHLASDAFGTTDELAQRALKNHIVACVARQYGPGTKYDHLIVFEGPQGVGKTRAITTLFGPEYVAEIHGEPMARDAMLTLRGKLCGDLSELSGLRKSDVERLKAWITLTVDEYRAPYARLPVIAPRRFVLVGTTNEHSYLLDLTGNRRFLPIRCGEINLDCLRENRAQLFAEAVVAYRDGYAFHQLPLEAAKAAQEERVITDPWAPILAKELMGADETSVGRCLELLEIPHKDRPRAIEQRIVGCLRYLGWVPGQRRRHDGAQIQFWKRG